MNIIPKNNIFFDNEKHIYFADSLKTISIPNYSYIVKDVLGDQFANIPVHIRVSALEKGKAVHKLTEQFDKNETINIDNPYYQYLLQWIRFKEDNNINQFDLIETPLFSKKYWYATAPDRFINGMLINIKTGKVYKEHRIQSAAEAIVIEENYDVTVTKRITVSLTEDTYKVTEYTMTRDFEYWVGIINVFKFKNFERG